MGLLREFTFTDLLSSSSLWSINSEGTMPLCSTEEWRGEPIVCMIEGSENYHLKRGLNEQMWQTSYTKKRSDMMMIFVFFNHKATYAYKSEMFLTNPIIRHKLCITLAYLCSLVMIGDKTGFSILQTGLSNIILLSPFFRQDNQISFC